MPALETPPASHTLKRPVNPWLQLITLFGLFAAGGVAGLGLSAWAAPGSGVASAVSVMLLPCAFAGGLLIWSGLEMLAVLRARRRAGRRPSAPPIVARTRSWFVPLSVCLSCPGGFIAGALPGGRGVLVTTVAYTLAGYAYGVVLSNLAARGYLPAPDLS